MTGTDLMILLKKHPIGVTCGIVSLLCGVTLYWHADTIDDTKLKVDDITKKSEAMVSNVRNAAGLAQQADTIQQATKHLESRLVKANQLATNLQYFYRLESDTGVKLTDVRQNQVGRAGGGLFVGIPYAVTFQGTFKQVMEFLQRVENGKCFSKYSSISFNKTAGTETAAGSLLSVSMNIELLGTP